MIDKRDTRIYFKNLGESVDSDQLLWAFREILTSDMEENGQIYVKMFKHWFNFWGEETVG